ncbi:acyl carrier protein [Pseudomonas maumuensis]|uniref:Acyl carrier protein n=1 Tax=Pseudomonas maumuensis TaxID=2842354 RepID=A0ABX8NF91_9PSED|nr:acyl carrier protein [Pseudomonas maumuensis]QXH54757.1 acyl carrier protein [Pseudomonas maumuensis]
MKIIDAIEIILADWIDTSTFDRNDDLFDQGINSLQMAILIDEINKRFNLSASLEVLAEGASMTALASTLSRKFSSQNIG